MRAPQLLMILPVAHALGRGARMPHSVARTPGRVGSPSMGTPVPFTANAPRDGGEIKEPEALWALSRMLQANVELDTAELTASIPTTFIRPAPATSRPIALFLHGADFSCLEWRFVLQPLCARGIDCVAFDWYSGGWTERAQITRRLNQGGVEPWTLVRQHLYAFWKQQLDSRPLILVGASLGGAVAIDFASTHPECVSKLVLIDAGGESYKAPPPDAPPPDVVAALASPVLGIKSFFQGVQAKLPDDSSRIVSLHRGQPGCYEASLAYLKSGSLARRVGQQRIKTTPQPTLVIWGTDDEILPLADAYAFQRDLPQCVGVREVAGSGHSPHLDNPQQVLDTLTDFLAA